MCARASSRQSAIEPVAAVAAPTEGRRELAALPSFLSNNYSASAPAPAPAM